MGCGGVTANMVAPDVASNTPAAALPAGLSLMSGRDDCSAVVGATGSSTSSAGAAPIFANVTVSDFTQPVEVCVTVTVTTEVPVPEDVNVKEVLSVPLAALTEPPVSTLTAMVNPESAPAVEISMGTVASEAMDRLSPPRMVTPVSRAAVVVTDDAAMPELGSVLPDEAKTLQT